MKRILITGGPTNEAIDEVMTITNMSTGSLSCDFAKTALDAGCAVTMIFHQSVVRSARFAKYGLGSNENAKLIPIDSCQDMYDALKAEGESGLRYDVVIHSAAVGDYKADFSFRMEDMAEELADAIFAADCLSREEMAELILKTMTAPQCKVNDDTKISSYEPNLTVKLTLTTKLISNLRKWFPDAFLVGSKLLENVTHEHLWEFATKLCNKNDMDMIMANDLAELRGGQLVRYYCNKDGFTGTQLVQSEMMDYAAENWFKEK